MKIHEVARLCRVTKRVAEALLFVVILALACLAIGFFSVCNGADYSRYECPEYAQAYHEGGLVIVSAKWCSACSVEKQSLTVARIPFFLVDVDRHPIAARELRTLRTIPETLLLRRVKNETFIVWRRGFVTVTEMRKALEDNP